MNDTKSVAFRFVKPLLNAALEDSSAHHLLIFLCLAAKNDTGESRHSQASMKSRTGMKSTTVRRATRRLVKLGLITCESQGKKTNLRYRVEYNKLVELSEAGKILCAERRKAKRESDSIDPKGYTATDSHRPQRVHDIDPKGPTTIDPKGPTELLSNYENKLLKELDANASKDSGSISGLETTLTMKPKTLPESEEQMLSILECQEELSKLTTRKDKAIVNGSFTPECPNMTAYNEINKQIQKWQQRLNLARGRAFQECQKTA